MNHFVHILLITAPILVMTNPADTTQYTNTDVYVPSTTPDHEEKPKEFLPKSECNFNKTSGLVSEKVKYFVYDCLQSNNNWLLINDTEANYIDVLRK